MYSKVLMVSLYFFLATVSGQNRDWNFKSGERLKFLIHYGIIDGGYAVSEVLKSPKYPSSFYLKSRAWSTGLAKLIVDLRYVYSSYIDTVTLLPKFFDRKVSEADFWLERSIRFDHDEGKAEITEKGEKTVYDIDTDVHDMLSVVMFLRTLPIDSLSIGDSRVVKVFLDRETFNFRLEFLGQETIDSEFGDVPCLKLKLYVQSGRLFKEETDLNVWVSSDANRVLIKVEAGLMFGAISVDLVQYSGLKYPLMIED